jgi:hypothetical protein
MPNRREPQTTAMHRPLLPSDHAFVVQFAARARGGRIGEVGRVEHLQSGEARHFHRSEELLAFTRRVLDRLSPPRRQP